MIAFGLSFIAGMLTTLSPCVLPVLPFVVGSALREHRLGPIGLASGLVTAFVVVGWTTAAFGSVVGLDQEKIRWLSAVFMALFGVITMSTRLQRSFTILLNPVSRGADHLLSKRKYSGIAGQFAVGCLLGALWSPCSGPTLGSAILLAAQAGGRLKSGMLLAVFGLGAAVPLLFLSYGFQSVFQKYRHRLLHAADRGKVVFGAIMLVVGLFIATGADRALERRLVERLPDTWISFTTKF